MKAMDQDFAIGDFTGAARNPSAFVFIFTMLNRWISVFKSPGHFCYSFVSAPDKLHQCHFIGGFYHG